MGQLIYRLKMEAVVMAYNNIFVATSMAFVVVLLVVVTLDKPKAKVAPQTAH